MSARFQTGTAESPPHGDEFRAASGRSSRADLQETARVERDRISSVPASRSEALTTRRPTRPWDRLSRTAVRAISSRVLPRSRVGHGVGNVGGRVQKPFDAATCDRASPRGLTDLGREPGAGSSAKIAGWRWTVALVGHCNAPRRAAVQLFSLIHSVDSERLAHRLEAVRDDRPCEALIQVNLTGAETQGGIEPARLSRLATVLDRETSLTLRGLMTIGPHGTDATSRACFRGWASYATPCGSACPINRLPSFQWARPKTWTLRWWKAPQSSASDALSLGRVPRLQVPDLTCSPHSSNCLTGW